MSPEARQAADRLKDIITRGEFSRLGEDPALMQLAGGDPRIMQLLMSDPSAMANPAFREHLAGFRNYLSQSAQGPTGAEYGRMLQSMDAASAGGPQPGVQRRAAPMAP
ncbi:MAG: hypothetical protein EKK41_07365 [Hyphomicrobiales bacterium]|nr:MAG: hypothetical protein EKK41_07365 [Hyphomicrobiales bacterium]